MTARKSSLDNEPATHRRAHTPGETHLSLYRSDEALALSKRHWCFKAGSRAAVQAFHDAGLAHGGRCDGPPGLRTEYHASYYAAFLRDPDGNRIEAVCHLRE